MDEIPYNPEIHLLVEGRTDELVARRLLEYAGLHIGTVRGRAGKIKLLDMLPNYNQAATYANWLVVIDLDYDDECAPSYCRSILPTPTAGMRLRIAVRSLEAWLMADRDHLATYLGISTAHIRDTPDEIDNPKAEFLSLARRCRRTALREDIVPRPNSGGRVGPGYANRIYEFLYHDDCPWRPEVASANSDSLRRCLDTLSNWELI